MSPQETIIFLSSLYLSLYIKNVITNILLIFNQVLSLLIFYHHNIERYRKLLMILTLLCTVRELSYSLYD